MKPFFGMVAVNDLNRVGKQFLGDVPDPLGAIAQNHLTLGSPKAAPLCLPLHAQGKVRKAIGGV